MHRQIVFDTETTGLLVSDGNRVIEIAGVEIVDGVITGKEIHFLVNPERDIEPDAFKVHGISREMLADKPLFKDILPEFLKFIKGAELIAHNAPFDEEHVQNEIQLANHSQTLWEVVPKITDTMLISKRVNPGSRHNLDALAKRYNISLEGREKHSALLDCKILAQVYLEMTKGLDLSAPDLETDVPRGEIHRIQRPNGGKTLVRNASAEEMQNHEKMLKDIHENQHVDPVEWKTFMRSTAHP